MANCQYLTPSITTQNQNVYRSNGNLAQVSTFSKTIDTPYSSVSKSDVRVSNPGIALAHNSYAAPIAHASYAAPIAHASYAAPIAHASYAAPIAHASYAAPIAHASYAAPIAHAAPLAHGGLLGVAYSAAPAVTHTTYSNGLGINYAW